MRIGCLQFAPQVGDVNNNLNRADAVLSRAAPEDLDLLVLPELAFTGYNFKSLAEISPFLEPTCAGITSLWARTTALKHNCVVAAGYPEKVDVSRNWPTSAEYYNSVIVVNGEGETIANYRKSHLYYTDETWALEGPDGFFQGRINGLGHVAMGICMDINPYKFEAPWSAYEFAFHVLDVAANVVVISMAWLTREDGRHFSRTPKEPDMETLTYWVTRFEPLIRAENEEEVIVIFANRTGIEEDAVYAGTSTVLGVRHGEVNVYGILGRGEKELLLVDTSLGPCATLVYRPDGEVKPVAATEDIAQPLPDSGASDQETQSSAPSALSVPSTGADSNPSTQHGLGAADTLLELPNGSSRYISRDHVSVGHDAPASIGAACPTTPFEESPTSPRYFWVPSDQSDSREFSLASPVRHSIDPAGSTTSRCRVDDLQQQHDVPKASSPREIEKTLEHELVHALKGLAANDASAETLPARPSSPKSRHASRSGRGERSGSILARKPSPAVFDQPHDVLSRQDVMIRPESPKSRNASRNQSRTRSVDISIRSSNPHRARSLSQTQKMRPAPIDLSPRCDSQSQRLPPTQGNASTNSAGREPEPSRTPDAGPIGADFIVVEEGERRPRRDSLECHADDDDFVVFHAATRRERYGISPTSDVERDSERRSSRGRGAPKYPGSPDNSFMRSPKRSTATGKHKASPEIADTRAFSRGRQRTAKWADATHSPKASNDVLSVSSKIDNWSIPVPMSVFSEYAKPETGKTSSNYTATSSRGRRSNSTKMRVDVAGTSPPPKSSKHDASRETPRELSEYNLSRYATTVQTVTTTLGLMPEFIPPTPKAMILQPDWDEEPLVPMARFEKSLSGPISLEVDRPKGLVG